MFFLTQQVISQFGDRQSDSMQYVHKEWCSLYTRCLRTND